MRRRAGRPVGLYNRTDSSAVSLNCTDLRRASGFERVRTWTGPSEGRSGDVLYDFNEGFSAVRFAVDGAGDDDLDLWRATVGVAETFDCGDGAETSRDKKRW